ncbi:MAG: s-methyl-5-thioribose-1-phosphate isomerase [Parasporobacterium sp.]|nr:s-methyl-5-thioribose-1-phosphate isomerase [Parasporobacterium sp.]
MLTFAAMRADEREQCAVLSAEALFDYVYFTAFIPNDKRRMNFLRHLMNVEFRVNEGLARFFTVKDEGEIKAVVQLCPPDYHRPQDSEYLKAGFMKCYTAAGLSSVNQWLDTDRLAGMPCRDLEHAWFISLIAVDRKYNRQGIGTRAIQECIIPYVNKQGGKELCLFTNSQVNCLFYEKNGFVRFHEQSFETKSYRLSSCSYKMELNPPVFSAVQTDEEMEDIITRAEAENAQAEAAADTGRIDDGLAFMLRFENVAWYSDGAVKILDRRIYPIRTEYVTCTEYIQVAEAIADMVTQSGGPYIAAAMGMVLAAYQFSEKEGDEFLQEMEKAAFALSHARPTTVEKMKIITESALNAVREGAGRGLCGISMVDHMMRTALEIASGIYKNSLETGKILAEKVPDNGTVMTMCFAETYIGYLLKALKDSGKTVKVICPETRPYFQGARLTASVARDMGFDVTVITDNMPGYVMKEKNVDLFTAAADVITMDGHVINKIGTFQMALAAKHWGIPFYVTGNPHEEHVNMDSVVIEERDPEAVLHAMDAKTVMEGVKGYYPAFDVTPPELVTGIVTDKGIFAANDLAGYFELQR